MNEIERELHTLFEDDQHDRNERLYETDIQSFMERDASRLARAKAIFDMRDELSPQSLVDLAFLFQHGQNSDDYKNAFDLASDALAKGHGDAAWLSAAAEDRYLLSIGQKQKWGTQFIQHGNEWKHEAMASDEESGITGDMRRQKAVPPRAEQLKAIAEKYQ